MTSPLGYLMVVRLLTGADFPSGLDLHPRGTTRRSGRRHILLRHPRLPGYGKVSDRTGTRICDPPPAERRPVLSGRRDTQMEADHLQSSGLEDLDWQRVSYFSKVVPCLADHTIPPTVCISMGV